MKKRQASFRAGLLKAARRLRLTKPTCVCAIAKNEAAFIEEWAAFHLAIGIDHIFIYDNESDDGLGDLLRSGRWPRSVTVVPWRSVQAKAPQREAYRHFIATYSRRFAWVAFLDIDEFFNLKVHETLLAFLNEQRRADAIGINWRMFGSSGLQTPSDELVITRFTRAAEPGYFINSHIKTIARCRKILQPDVHSHHLCDNARFVAPNGEPRLAGVNMLQPVIDLETVQINHYFAKTRAEFAEKRRRGRADLPPDDASRFRDAGEFDVYDRNEAEDLSIQRWRPAVLRKLAAMRDVPQHRTTWIGTWLRDRRRRTI